MRYFADEIVEKIRTQILCSITFFRKSCRFYEIMWEIIVEPGRQQMTIWHMCIAAVYLSLQTQAEYVMLIAFQLQKCLYERNSVLRHRYIVSLVMIYAGKN